MELIDRFGEGLMDPDLLVDADVVAADTDCDDDGGLPPA